MKYNYGHLKGIRISIWINYSFDCQQPFLLLRDEDTVFKPVIKCGLFLAI
jgi:hypothetical protein